MGRVTSPVPALPDDYAAVLADLKAKVLSAHAKAQRTVNTQLIALYWSIGKAILNRQSAAGWGAKVIDQLAADLTSAFPDSTGFSRRNLHYMQSSRRRGRTQPLCNSLLHNFHGGTASSH